MDGEKWGEMSLERGQVSDDQGLCTPCLGFGLELIDDSALLKDTRETQDQVCNVGRSIQKRIMDSNREPNGRRNVISTIQGLLLAYAVPLHELEKCVHTGQMQHKGCKTWHAEVAFVPRKKVPLPAGGRTEPSMT